MKKSLKQIRFLAFKCIDVFFFPILLKSYRLKLNTIDKNAKLLWISRLDFGTFLMHLHYASIIPKKKVVIVVCTPKFDTVVNLAKNICPRLQIIKPDFSLFIRFLSFCFGLVNVQNITFTKIFHKLFSKYSSFAIYHPHFFQMKMSNLHKKLAQSSYEAVKNRISPEFIRGYQSALKNYEKDRSEKDFYQYSDLSFRQTVKINEKTTSNLDFIKKKCGIGDRYVVLNINCKSYKYRSKLIRTLGNIRRINHPERYNVLIDLLVEQGMDVVIQGRDEQPRFTPRKGLHYIPKEMQTVSIDCALYSDAYFCITCKTGPEIYANIFNRPVLSLNYTELFSLMLFKKHRFFPKHIINLESGKPFSWKEWLYHEVYFNNDGIKYAYEEMSEEEIFDSLKEFLRLMENSQWYDWTPLQQEFKNSLSPIHLDLYYSKGSPCESFLRSKYHENSSFQMNNSI